VNLHTVHEQVHETHVWGSLCAVGCGTSMYILPLSAGSLSRTTWTSFLCKYTVAVTQFFHGSQYLSGSRGLTQVIERKGLLTCAHAYAKHLTTRLVGSFVSEALAWKARIGLILKLSPFMR